MFKQSNETTAAGLFLKQIWWVLVTYATRPMIWGTVIFVAVSLTFSLFMGLASRPTIQPPRHPSRQALFEVGQSSVPKRIEILPSAVETTYHPFGFLFLMPSLCLAGVIGAQLSSQFREPASRLMPGFAASHALVAVTLAGLTTAFATAGLAAQGAKVFPALIMVAAAFTSCVGNMSMISVVGSLESKWSRWPGFLFIMVSFGSVMSFVFAPRFVEQLLKGDFPLLLAVLLAITIGAIIMTVWILRNLSAWAAAAGTVAVTNPWQPFTFDPQKYRSGWGVNLEARAERIKALCQEGTRWNWWNRVQRWRLGNPPVPVILMMFVMLAVMLVYSFLPLGFSIRTFGDLSFYLRTLRSGLFMAFFMPIIMVASAWRVRMLALPLEVLRPYSRSRLQHEQMAALLLDLLPGVAFVSALASLTLNVRPPFEIDWRWIPLDFIGLFLFAFPVATLISALMIVVERKWLALFLAAFGNVFWVITLPPPGSEKIDQGLSQSVAEHVFHGRVALGIVAIYATSWLLAIVVSGLMARRWLRMELDRK